MKVYSHAPGSETIRVSDGRGLIVTDNEYALRIVGDVLNNDLAAAKRYLRFRWRWSMFDGWTDALVAKAVTENQVREVIAQIDKSAADSEQMVRRMANEKPMIVSDSPGPGQEWDSNPELKPKERPHVTNQSGKQNGDPGD